MSLIEAVMIDDFDRRTKEVNKQLLAGADVNQIERFEEDDLTPLNVAVLFDYEDTVIKLLENKADPNQYNKKELYPIKIAAEAQNFNMVRLLLRHGANPFQAFEEDDLTPLNVAVLFDFEDKVIELLENKADPNQYNKKELYPIKIAAEAQNFYMVKLLLGYGANPFPALLYAAKNDDIDLIKNLVLDCGISVSCTNDDGYTVRESMSSPGTKVDVCLEDLENEEQSKINFHNAKKILESFICPSCNTRVGGFGVEDQGKALECGHRVCKSCCTKKVKVSHTCPVHHCKKRCTKATNPALFKGLLQMRFCVDTCGNAGAGEALETAERAERRQQLRQLMTSSVLRTASMAARSSSGSSSPYRPAR
jgi:ankyrin repeat protein